jgi:hypothetical protein
LTLRRRNDNDDNYDDGDDDADDDLHLHVFPEVLSLDFHGGAMELLGSFLKRRTRKTKLIFDKQRFTKNTTNFILESEM